MNVVWAPEALDDVTAAVDYLVTHHARDAANKLVVRLLALTEKLATEPIDGPEQMLTNGQRVRGWPLPPFRVYYQRNGDALTVLRVYHQRKVPL